MTDFNCCLYGCETWSLKLREGHRQGVFENGVLREMFVPKTEEVTEGWRELHSEKLRSLYPSPNIMEDDQMKEDTMGNACSTCGYNISVEKRKWKKTLGKQGRRLEHNIKMNLKIKSA